MPSVPSGCPGFPGPCRAATSSNGAWRDTNAHTGSFAPSPSQQGRQVHQGAHLVLGIGQQQGQIVHQENGRRIAMRPQVRGDAPHPLAHLQGIGRTRQLHGQEMCAATSRARVSRPSGVAFNASRSWLEPTTRLRS